MTNDKNPAQSWAEGRDLEPKLLEKLKEEEACIQGLPELQSEFKTSLDWMSSVSK